MLAPNGSDSELKRSAPKSETLLAEEQDHYEGYPWCLNPHLTVREATEYLGDEIGRLAAMPRGWQSGEVATNVYLLSCGLLNSVDEYLRGPALRLPARLAGMRVGRAARWCIENVRFNRNPKHKAYVARWRMRLVSALDELLSVLITDATPDPSLFVPAQGKFMSLLETSLPAGLLAERVGVPSPFRRLDLTQHDIVALGRRYVQRFPDRSCAILLVGARTSGSYFVPVLKAYLTAQGYEAVSFVTLGPSKGAGREERKELKRYAAKGYTAVIVDDPPHTGGAILTALEIVNKAGFGRDMIRVLFPTHPARRDLSRAFADNLVVTLEPEGWHKTALLEPEVVQTRLAEYFSHQDFAQITVVDSDRVEALNEHLKSSVSDERGARLKRIFEVKLVTRQGQVEIRYVLAKSVGWGWLGYHAFLAGQRLANFVPPILGLRDGILYMEWIPGATLNSRKDPGAVSGYVETAASYIAARARNLSLADDSLRANEPSRQNNGAKLLCTALSKAYGVFPANILAQRRLGRLLRQLPCPFPTFIDGNMRRDEWIVGPNGLLKIDYEHHGLGKEELNLIDPAYDLADTTLNWNLSPEEESRLVRRYIEESGDTGVEHRLLLNKFIAGLWGMKRAHEQLFDKAATIERQRTFHERFMAAWDFLTVQSARYCGRQCRSKPSGRWRSPIVATDIDGVLDRRAFGFPCTSAAGIEAITALHTHGFSVAVDTARSVAEVKAYCDAYGFAGGVAEHGSYVWNAVDRCGRSLIGREALAQLDKLKQHLRELPGVFLDERHEYSIRAFTYKDKPRGIKRKLLNYLLSSGVGDDVVGPVSTLLIQHLMTALKLDLLSYHHTNIDTTIVAKEVSKGKGLVALRDWVLGEDAETVAIGDQEPDLAMFEVATHSFAPSNIGCGREARVLGCHIADRSFQRGLLEITGEILAAYRPTAAPSASAARLSGGPDILMEALHAADRSWFANLKSVVFQTIVPRSRK